MIHLPPFDLSATTAANLERHSLDGLRTLTVSGEFISPHLLPLASLESCEGSMREAIRRNGTTCRCNATHGVRYVKSDADTSFSSLDAQEADISHVTVVRSKVSFPRTPPRLHPDAIFLQYSEPPHNLDFQAAPGFDGVVGFRRPRVLREPACGSRAVCTTSCGGSSRAGSSTRRGTTSASGSTTACRTTASGGRA